MEQIGIYEQLTIQVVEQNLNRKRFYVGERVLGYTFQALSATLTFPMADERKSIEASNMSM
ncbi:hypothetical protein PCIT_b0411 [Pseudoalteromonas citrea]|uniref:Uncharacterized protein n=2 Tax=Pseudoalteromonas citrea TaxID=43655 RepID=A0AAD4FPT0_9GAMM|nr:hypothetical protein [Pseudoalteromonas citrea]KAF7764415.1 hypothetical protein PCIT_b0411 [Pseudoalteromonas citrea]